MATLKHFAFQSCGKKGSRLLLPISISPSLLLLPSLCYRDSSAIVCGSSLSFFCPLLPFSFGLNIRKLKHLPLSNQVIYFIDNGILKWMRCQRGGEYEQEKGGRWERGRGQQNRYPNISRYVFSRNSRLWGSLSLFFFCFFSSPPPSPRWCFSRIGEMDSF